MTPGARDRAGGVAVPFNPADPSNVLMLRSAQDAAGTLGVTVRPVPVRSPDEFEAAFSALAASRIEALVVAAGALTDTHAGRLAQQAAQVRIPTVYGAPEFVEAGGLVSYSASSSPTRPASPTTTGAPPDTSTGS